MANNLTAEALKLLEIQEQLLRISKKLIEQINAPERVKRATKREKQVAQFRRV